MSHARIEEVSDSDPEIEDPSDFLPSNSRDAIQDMSIPSSTFSAPREPYKPSNPTLLRSPAPTQSADQNTGVQQTARDRAEIKTHCTLYPLYFDSSRTRAQGRRIHTSLATPNPLAFNLLTALRSIISSTGHLIPLTLEPDKTHPKDWSNPGRIRIQLFTSAEEGHVPTHPTIRTKSHLYRLIGSYLKEHPTTKNDPLQLKIPGLPVPENFGKEDVAVPRGWRMNSVLPVHSAAVSGGGVSDNFFKEAMAEMQKAGGGAGALPGGGGGGMPDMSALQNMMGGMGGMFGGGGAGGGQSIEGGGGGGGKKKKGKKG